MLSAASSFQWEQVEIAKFKRTSEKTISQTAASLKPIIISLPQESQSIYRDLSKNLLNQATLSTKFSHDTDSKSNDQIFLETILDEVASIQDEMKADPIKKNRDLQIKKQIENTILSYQKDFIEPIKQYILPRLTQWLKQKGSMNMYINTKLGSVDISLKNFTSHGNQKEGNFTFEGELYLDLDMNIPPKSDCRYTEDYDYVCTPSTSWTGKLTLSISVPINMTKQDEILYFGADKIQVRNSSFFSWGTGTSINPLVEIQKSINEFNKSFAGKTYKISLPSELKDGQLAVEQQIAIIELLSRTSILTPAYRNNTEYVLNWNPEFLKKYTKIFPKSQKPKSLISENIRYKKDGTLSYKILSGQNNSVGTLSIGKVQSVTTIQLSEKSAGEYGSSSSYNVTIQPDAIDLTTSTISEYAGEDIFTLNWNQKNFYAQYSGESLKWIEKNLLSDTQNISPSEKSKWFEIRGTLWSQDTQLSINMYTKNIGSIGMRSFNGVTNFDFILSIPDVKIRSSALLEEFFTEYIPNIPKDAILIDDINPLDSLSDLSDDITATMK